MRNFEAVLLSACSVHPDASFGVTGALTDDRQCGYPPARIRPGSKKSSIYERSRAGSQHGRMGDESYSEVQAARDKLHKQVMKPSVNRGAILCARLPLQAVRGRHRDREQPRRRARSYARAPTRTRTARRLTQSCRASSSAAPLPRQQGAVARHA